MKKILYTIPAKLYKNSHSDPRGYVSITVGFFSYLLSSGLLALSMVFSNFVLSQKIEHIGSNLFPIFTNLKLTLLVGSSRPSNMEVIQLSLSYFLTSQIFQVLIIGLLVLLGVLLFKANFIKAFVFALTIVLTEILLSIFFGQIL